MDIFELKQLAIQLRRSILDAGVTVDGIVLFGSHARGTARIHSDIDFAMMSRSFGKDRFKEGCFVNKHAFRVHPDLEAIPVSIRQWFDPQTIWPIFHEIKKDGICQLQARIMPLYGGPLILIHARHDLHTLSFWTRLSRLRLTETCA